MRILLWSSQTLLLCLTFISQTQAVLNLQVSDLMGQLDSALREAQTVMKRFDRILPPSGEAYTSGGACYRAFGTSLSYRDCRGALALMPSVLYGPDEIKMSATGLWVNIIYGQSSPLIWRHGNCVIGVTVFDEMVARGLQRTFRAAAGTIVDNCVTRAVGGMVRFAHFEVIVFDETLLPREFGDPLLAFAHKLSNIPLSAGLKRLWSERAQ